MKNPPEKSKVVTSANGAFVGTLTSMKRGEVLSDLDAALRDVAGSVGNFKKPGLLTVKLKIEFDGESDAGTPMYTVDVDISTKKPTKSRGKSKFFGDEDGNLLRDDPAQSEMPEVLSALQGGKVDPAVVHAKPVAQ